MICAPTARAAPRAVIKQLERCTLSQKEKGRERGIEWDFLFAQQGGAPHVTPTHANASARPGGIFFLISSIHADASAPRHRAEACSWMQKRPARGKSYSNEKKCSAKLAQVELYGM